MKVKYHFPTERFGFVETEEQVGSLKEAVKKYHEAKEGLEEAEFRLVLDSYMVNRTMESYQYENMNWLQQTIIQTLKRAFKRLKSKE